MYYENSSVVLAPVLSEADLARVIERVESVVSIALRQRPDVNDIATKRDCADFAHSIVVAGVVIAIIQTIVILAALHVYLN
jgi:hypothetical protein